MKKAAYFKIGNKKYIIAGKNLLHVTEGHLRSCGKEEIEKIHNILKKKAEVEEMENKKLIKAAKGAKKDGYEFMSVVVKQENKQRLYHISSIDVILQFGEWVPAKIQQIPDSTDWGVKVYKELPPKTISKADALRRYGK